VRALYTAQSDPPAGTTDGSPAFALVRPGHARRSTKAGLRPSKVAALVLARSETGSRAIESIGYPRQPEYPIVRQKIAMSGNPFATARTALC
jgi:hypothetical protein